MPPKKKPPITRINPDELEVVPIPGKNNELGIRTLVDLAPNSRLHYDGKRIGEAEYKRLEALNVVDASGKYTGYTLGLGPDPSRGGEQRYVDPNPRYFEPLTHLTDAQKDALRKKWIGGRSNEPQPKEKANLLLRYETNNSRRREAWLVTVRAVKAGEELTWHYGPSYQRTYRVGQKATRPKWW